MKPSDIQIWQIHTDKNVRMSDYHPGNGCVLARWLSQRIHST